MKKFYEKAELEVVNFEVNDIIRTSDPDMGNAEIPGFDEGVAEEE